MTDYQRVLNSWAVREFLRHLTGQCKADGSERLAVALELFSGTRVQACYRCRLAYFVVKPFISAASRSLGSSPEELVVKTRDPYWRKGLLNVVEGVAWFGGRKPFVPGAPFQVVWNVTRACNLKCLHCYADAARVAPDELLTARALQAVDALADAGILVLAFSGGEPTLRADILDLIERARFRGMYVALATNGISFASSDRVREFKESGLRFVQISLDGANARTHDSFRGVRGAFDQTVKGIGNCVREGLFVEVAATVTAHNMAEVPSLIELTEKLGASWFMMYNFVPTGRGRQITEMDLSPQERDSILRILWNRMQRGGVNVLSTAPQFAKIAQEEATGTCAAEVVPTHFYNPVLAGNLKRMADFIGGCGAGRFYISMEPNGDLYPCVFFPHEESLKLGNIFDGRFGDMWRSSELLRRLRDKASIKGACSGCEYRYTCGGCRARAYSYFHDLAAPDPGCSLNAGYWNRLSRDLRPQTEIAVE